MVYLENIAGSVNVTALRKKTHSWWKQMHEIPWASYIKEYINQE